MEYTALLEKQIIGRLRIDNPWWTLGSVPDFYADMKPRLYLDVFYPLVKDIDLRRATVLMGPRRVGKTVMMYHSIQRLINEGTNPQNIIYINVEAPIYNKIFIWHVKFWTKIHQRKPCMYSTMRFNILKIGKLN